jgi:hypothetical protein
MELVIAPFAPAVTGGFVHDDHRQIAGNPLLQDLRRLPSLWATDVWAGVGSASSWYRPLMMSSFALDHAFFGLSPFAMHAVSLVLHAALVVLCFAARARRSEWRSAERLSAASTRCTPSRSAGSRPAASR